MRGSRARACGAPRLSQAQRSCLGELTHRPNGRLARRKAHLNFLNLCLTAAARARPYFENCVSLSTRIRSFGSIPPQHPAAHLAIILLRRPAYLPSTRCFYQRAQPYALHTTPHHSLLPSVTHTNPEGVLWLASRANVRRKPIIQLAHST